MCIVGPAVPMEPKNTDGKANDKSASGITMDAVEEDE